LVLERAGRMNSAVQKSSEQRAVSIERTGSDCALLIACRSQLIVEIL
jgi:hypothetical protein